MNLEQAYVILGTKPGDDEKTIKEKYRKLIFKYHPDSVMTQDEVSLEKTQRINEAYSVIRKRGTKNINLKTSSKWAAEIVPDAYRERTVFIAGGEYEGYRLSNIPVAEGRYEWDPDLEEFDMLLFSLNKLTQELIEEVERDTGIYDGDTGLSEEQKKKYHLRLFHLLAQQYIEPVSCLKRIAVPEVNEKGIEAYLFREEVKIIDSAGSIREAKRLKAGDPVIPIGFEENRIRLGTISGNPLGYLSFLEDELYYVLIPILKEKLAKIKIEVAERTVGTKGSTRAYFPVKVYIRLEAEKMPERNLNTQIKKVLLEYGSHIK